MYTLRLLIHQAEFTGVLANNQWKFTQLSWLTTFPIHQQENSLVFQFTWWKFTLKMKPSLGLGFPKTPVVNWKNMAAWSEKFVWFFCCFSQFTIAFVHKMRKSNNLQEWCIVWCRRSVQDYLLPSSCEVGLILKVGMK